MDLQQEFQEFIKKEGLFQRRDRLLLAVSGGIDSVVLTKLCALAGYSFSIAHCNFQLRNEESEGDELFVRDLALQYEVPFHVKQFDTSGFAALNKMSIQVAARYLRYKWFDELLQNPINQDQYSACAKHYLLTAHHADDNIETILMNFFKGSGINGIKGIVPKNNQVLRPLLFARKENLSAFAGIHQLQYRTDSSNTENKYTRNYFRNELIPALEKVFPMVKENIIANAERFREIQVIYDDAVKLVINKLIIISGTEIHIPVLKLLKTPALHTIVFEIISKYGFSVQQVKEALKLLHSDSGKFIISGSHRILRNRKWLIISPIQSDAVSHYLVERSVTEIFFANGQIQINEVIPGESFDPDPGVALIDTKALIFPLLLRKWQKGDYFYPLGMNKKKKLSRFLTDKKLSLNDKEKTWVIETNKKIVWVVGHRIDERFKINSGTQQALKLRYLK